MLCTLQVARMEDFLQLRKPSQPIPLDPKGLEPDFSEAAR
jgi:hypothetical protein